MTEYHIGRIDPVKAQALLEEDPHALLIDVRSRVEYEFVGHPVNAIHLAWKEFPSWEERDDFIEQLESELNKRGDAAKTRALLFICRSGARSLAAARLLCEHGYTNVYNVEEGFEGDKDARNHRGTINGWRFHGLPWEQT